MNTWAIFQSIFDDFATPFIAMITELSGRLIDALTTPLTMAVTAWLGFTSAMELFNPGGGEPMTIVVRKLLRAAFVMALLTQAAYTPLFVKFMGTDLPNDLTLVVAGGTAGAAGVGPKAFDQMLGSGMAGILTMWDKINTWSPKQVMFGMAATMMFGFGAFFIAIGFAIYFIAFVSIGLCIIFGPIPVCCLLWDKSVFIFQGWINVLLAAIFTQVLVVVLLAALMKMVQTSVDALIALNESNAIDNLPAQVHNIFNLFIFFFLLGYLAPRVERIAESIVRAAGPGVSGMSQMMHGALASATGQAAVAAAPAAQALAIAASSNRGSRGMGGNHAGQRSTTPARGARRP